MLNAIILPILVALVAIIGGLSMGWWMLRPIFSGGQSMVDIKNINADIRGYLVCHYRILALVAGIIFLIIGFFHIGWATAQAFLLGILLSSIAGLVAIYISIYSSRKIIKNNNHSSNQIFDIAMRGGIIIGFLVAGLALLGVIVSYIFWEKISLFILVGLCFGGSIVSIFSRWGGSIYRKAVEFSINLIKKIEVGATNDNNLTTTVNSISDSIGTTADLFETYTIVLSSAMILGGLIFGAFPAAIIYPLVLSGAGIIISLFSSLFIKLRGQQSSTSAFYQGLGIAGIVTVVAYYFITNTIMVGNGIYSIKALFGSTLIGLLSIAALVATAWYYKFTTARLKKNSGNYDDCGTNIIQELFTVINLTIWPTLVLVIVILTSYYLANLYGIALAGVAALSFIGIMVAIDICSSIINKIDGITKISEASAETDMGINSLKNAKHANSIMINSYNISSAAWATLLLFVVYLQEFVARNQQISFSFNDTHQHFLLAGIFIGSIISCLFVGLFTASIMGTLRQLMKKMQDQFSEYKISVGGLTKVDYYKVLVVIYKLIFKQIVSKLFILLLVPVLVGFVFGPEALVGVLIGAMVVGLIVSMFVFVSGIIWGNEVSFSGETIFNIGQDVTGLALSTMVKAFGVISLLIVAFLI